MFYLHMTNLLGISKQFIKDTMKPTRIRVCKLLFLFAIFAMLTTYRANGENPPRVSRTGPALLSFEHPVRDYMFLSSALRYQDYFRQINGSIDVDIIKTELNILPRPKSTCSLSGAEDWSSNFQRGKSRSVFAFVRSGETFANVTRCLSRLLSVRSSRFTNLVFDEEGVGAEARIAEFMVDPKRRAVKNVWRDSVRVGNYGMMPYSTARWSHYPQGRNAESDTAFYNQVGMRIAMPILYGYSFYARHGTPGSNFPENERSPGAGVDSYRAGMFWAQLEQLTAAKERLPANHLLIPWTNVHFKLAGNNRGPIPTRASTFALMKHFRLRGADGFVAFAPHGESPSFTKLDPATQGSQLTDYRKDFAQSWLANFAPERASSVYTQGDYIVDCRNAWACLDELYGPEIQTQLHFDGSKLHGKFGPETKNQRDLKNFEDKTEAFHVSGARYVNTVYFLASNLSSQDKTLRVPALAEVREGVSQRLYDFEPKQVLTEVPKMFTDSSLNDPYPSNSNHVEYVHRITNLLKNSGFENREEGWMLPSGAKIVSGGGVDGSDGLSFRSSMGPVAAVANACDAEPGARMKIYFSAKGTNCNLGTLLYYDDGDEVRSQQVRWSDGRFYRNVAGKKYSTYSAEFEVNPDFVANLRPRFFLADTDDETSRNVSIDNVVIKFADRNLLEQWRL